MNKLNFRKLATAAGLSIALLVTGGALAAPDAVANPTTATNQQFSINENRNSRIQGANNAHHARVGQRLEIVGRNTLVTPNATRWTQQWLRDGRPIPNATGRTYTVRNADRGAFISVELTAHRNGFADQVFLLNPVVALGEPTPFGRTKTLNDDIRITAQTPINATEMLRSRGGSDWFEPDAGNAFWVIYVDIDNRSEDEWSVWQWNPAMIGFLTRQNRGFSAGCPWDVFAQEIYEADAFLDIFGTFDLATLQQVGSLVHIPPRTWSRQAACVQAPINALRSGNFGLFSEGEWGGIFYSMWATPNS